MKKTYRNSGKSDKNTSFSGLKSFGLLILSAILAVFTVVLINL